MHTTTLGAFALVVLSTTANAALTDRGNGMIYDDVLDITWLQDANYAMTSGFDTDGLMDWDTSVDWAANLIVEGFDDWRLPSMDVNGDQSIVDCSTAPEAACRDNELGYMFHYNLMGMVGDDRSGDVGLFTNVQINHWSGTEYEPTSNFAWLFVFQGGGWGYSSNGSGYSAWAVRPGDVAVVPLPAGVWLLGSVLLGLAGIVRTSPRQQPVVDVFEAL